MSRIAAYRNYAAECLALADKVADESGRRSLIEMAASWHELALMLETYMEEHDGQEPPFTLEMPAAKRQPTRRH
jgi:hypothetical protein